MKKIAGIVCITIALLGLIFFRNYHGTAIPFPFVWIIFFIGTGCFGVWLIFLFYKESNDAVLDVVAKEIALFKKQARAVELDFDKCEFKSGSYSIEVEHPNVPLVAAFAPAALAFDNNTMNVSIHSSYLIYMDDSDGKPQRYVSASFPFDETVLKVHVLKKTLKLYVSRAGDKKCFFELSE